MTHADWSAPVRRRVQRASGTRAVLLACALASAAVVGERPLAAEPIKVAVYAFELEDFSAAGGIIPPNARDATYLAQATEEAKRWLSQSGRYAIVDTAGAQDEPVKAHTMRSCSGCLGPITKRLGADQAVIGTITRISRTECTLLIQFFDAGTGEPVSNYFTGLRMGADYAWARGVTWLMKNRILAKSRGGRAAYLAHLTPPAPHPAAHAPTSPLGRGEGASLSRHRASSGGRGRKRMK